MISTAATSDSTRIIAASCDEQLPLPVTLSAEGPVTGEVDARRKRNSIAILIWGCALVLCIGWLDKSTGWEWSLFVFYALPILLVVWYGDRFTALLFALVCTGVWWWANVGQHPYSTDWGYAVATLSRLAYFLFVAIGGAALRHERDVDKQRVKALEHARELEKDIVRISEEEQRRIGQELHDGLCQYLAGIKCAVGILRNHCEKKGKPETAKLREIELMLKDGVTQARDLARGVFPVMADELGFAAAVEELTRNAGRMYGREVEFEMQGDVSVHHPESAMHLYRISQEALSNAMRHASASRISMQLSGDAKSVTLIVDDDGCGMDGSCAGKGGMGLRTLQYRARSLGAELSVNSRPGGGTRVRCQYFRSLPDEDEFLKV